MKRKATAIWNGTIKEGKGNLTTQSGTLKENQYSFKSRFESGTGTNPEELIAAAHAGCFAMQLSAYLGEEGYEPETLEATGEVSLDDGSITQSHINLKAKVREIENDKFQELVNKAKDNCPVSKLLDTKISVDAVLNQ